MGLNGVNGWTDWTLGRAKPHMERFLERLRTTGNVLRSCEAAGIPRSTAYYWRDKFTTFAHAWDEALDDAIDLLDEEAWRRAIKKNSDQLLIFLLKAHRASVYNPPQRIEQDNTVRVLRIDWDAADDSD